MKKSILTSSLLSIALAANLLAGAANDIAAKHAAASAAELEAYLTKTPDAADKADAVEHLIGAYSLTGNDKRVAELMQTKFEAIKGGKDVDPQELFMTTQMLFARHLENGDKEAAQKLLASATEKSKGHALGAKLAQTFEQMGAQLKQPGVGDVMEIKFKSTEGKEIDLAEMQGKVVLVDFWATWCGPCVAELPNVLDTYAKHHDKGFEVLGISLDQEKEKLEKFVENKKMPWPQYFDGKGWSNDISTSFSITSIPATFLIGKDGKVAATNLRGEELEAAVAEELAK